MELYIDKSGVCTVVGKPSTGGLFEADYKQRASEIEKLPTGWYAVDFKIDYLKEFNAEGFRLREGAIKYEQAVLSLFYTGATA